MKMKWAIAGLFVLGIISALGAALLVVAMRTEKRRANAVAPPRPEVQIVLARQALPANTVLDSNCIITRNVPKEEVPAHAMPGASHVIGRVLAVPMAQEQVVTENCLATEGSGRQIAAAVPPGMRAVSVAMHDHAVLEGILYPGCLVDVLVSIKSTDREAQTKEEWVAVPLLQRIQVLAVGDQTLFTPEEQHPAKQGGISSRVAQRLVTLMVDPDQARALQLASEMGSLSLTLRNPFDRDHVSTAPMLASDLFSRARPVPAATAASSDEAASPMPAPPPQRQVLVIRGGNLTKQSFSWPE